MCGILQNLLHKEFQTAVNVHVTKNIPPGY